MTSRTGPDQHANLTTGPASGLAHALERNIEALVARRDREAAQASFSQRSAERITAFIGSMPFVWLHLVLFGGWIAANTVMPLPRWDPSLVVLAMAASVEAIFLSTFVLINQNRMAAEDEKRAELNLQISLINEHETTKLLALLTRVAKHLEIDLPADPEIEDLQRDIRPEAVLDRLDADRMER